MVYVFDDKQMETAAKYIIEYYGLEKELLKDVISGLRYYGDPVDLAALTAENTRLKEFARLATRVLCWDDGDGGNLQDEAKRLGLIAEGTYLDDDGEELSGYVFGEILKEASDEK